MMKFLRRAFRNDDLSFVLYGSAPIVSVWGFYCSVVNGEWLPFPVSVASAVYFVVLGRWVHRKAVEGRMTRLRRRMEERRERLAAQRRESDES